MFLVQGSEILTSKNEFEKRALGGKGQPTWTPRKDHKNPLRLHKDSMRCEAIGCSNEVRESFMTTCDECHAKASADKPIKLIGLVSPLPIVAEPHNPCQQQHFL